MKITCLKKATINTSYFNSSFDVTTKANLRLLSRVNGFDIHEFLSENRFFIVILFHGFYRSFIVCSHSNIAHIIATIPREVLQFFVYIPGTIWTGHHLPVTLTCKGHWSHDVHDLVEMCLIYLRYTLFFYK